jgi:hypothetical protein
MPIPHLLREAALGIMAPLAYAMLNILVEQSPEVSIGIILVAAITLLSWKALHHKIRPKDVTPHLNALPNDVWTRWPHLNRKIDAQAVDRYKRLWDAAFVVLPKGVHEHYGVENLVDIAQEVAGEGAMWDNVTTEGYLEIARRMNGMRDELFVREVEEVNRGVLLELASEVEEVERLKNLSRRLTIAGLDSRGGL